MGAEMINLENLNRQHQTIKNEINYIESELNAGILSINTSEAAVHINRLDAKK